MSGLIGNIVTNTEALNIHTKGLQVTGRNLANVNNPAYARQRLTQLSQPGLGQQIARVEQVRDSVLDSRIVSQNSTVSALESQSGMYDQLESVLSDSLSDYMASTLDSASSESNVGLSSAFTDFFNSWSALAANPSDAATKENVILQGEKISGLFNEAAAGLEDLSTDVQDRMASDVADANELLQQIASLNEQIINFETNSRNTKALDLRDSRQQALEELSKYMNVTGSEDAIGNLSVMSVDNTGNQVGLVNANSAVTLGFDAANFTVTANGNTLQLDGGSLGGLQQFRNTEIVGLSSDLDTLTAEFVSAVNGAYGSGDFFNPASTTAASISIAPSANDIIAGVNSGSNENALGVADLANEAVVGLGNKTFAGYTLDKSSEIAAESSKIQQKLETEELAADMLEERRSEVSGVSLDEETTNLLRFQRSFQASAKVINTLDSLLGLVVTNLGS